MSFRSLSIFPIIWAGIACLPAAEPDPALTRILEWAGGDPAWQATARKESPALFLRR